MSRKVAFIAFLLICICLRAYNEYLFPLNLDDRPRQLGYAQSLIKGYGIGSIQADTQDLSKTIFTVQGNFAPAYPLLVAPLLYLIGNPFIADWLLKTVVIIIFFYAWYSIFLLISEEVSFWAFILLLSFWALSPSPFHFFISTDFHSLAFYFLSAYILLKTIAKHHTYSPKKLLINAILLGIISFTCSFFRFSYYPFSLLIPCFWLFISLLYYKALRKYSLICLITTCLLIICQLFYQYQISEINFVNNRYADKLASSSTYYWSSLKHFNFFAWEAFFHASFFNVRQYLDKSIDFPPNWYEGELYAKIIFTIIIICLIIKVLNIFFKFKNNNLSPLFILYALGLLTILVNVGFITSMSIYYPPEEGFNTFWKPEEPTFWTFVLEARYFAPSIIFIQFFVFSMPFVSINYLKKYHLFRLVSLCIIGSSLLYSWVIWYYPIRWQVNSYSSYKENVRAFHLFIYEELPKIAAQEHTVVSADVVGVYHTIASAAGYKTIDFGTLLDKINTNSLHTSKPMKIVILKHDASSDSSLKKLYQQYKVTKKITYFERLPMKKKAIEVLFFDILSD